jgi:hypothetical protein
MSRRIPSLFAAGLLTLAATATAVLVTASPASAATICDQYGTTVAGNYIIQNNRWGSSATQCISTTANGFSIIQQDGIGNLSGAPASYPSIYLGCHYTNCSPNSPLPARISSFSNAPSSISVSYPSSGTWDAAYDIWLNADTDVSGVQDTEIMIWLNRQGGVQPVGSDTGNNVSIAGQSWRVWTGHNGQNFVVSYVANSALTSLTFNVKDFITDTLGRGSQYGNTNWYLTSIQAGFEPWIGGVGLTVNSFSASIGGSAPQVPGTPGTPVASNVTAGAVTLTWSPSSGTVTNYQIERATGASSTSFTQVGTATGTSFTDTGLAAGTTYRYRVRATNAAGNSAYSGIVNVTTSAGGGGGGGGSCSAAYSLVNAWPGGFQGEVTVTGAANGWTVTLTFTTTATLTQIWNANATPAGNTVTFTNLSYNAQGGTFGFLASTSGAAGSGATVSCTSP